MHYSEKDFHCLEHYFSNREYDSSDEMQFTGLKDESSIELYDGDIYEQWGKVQKCEFDQVIYEIAECLIFEGDFKIIGNIYENPELLESK